MRVTELQSRWRQLRTQLPPGVNLLAVSKMQPASAVRELAACGQFDFGESRVQEALPKQEALSDLTDLRWHFIGRLQANKVRAVVKAFSWIHSIDSMTLAERVSRIAEEEGPLKWAPPDEFKRKLNLRPVLLELPLRTCNL